MSKSKNAILKEISNNEFLSVEDKEVLKSFDKADLYALIDMLLCDKALLAKQLQNYQDRYNEYLDKNAKMQNDKRMEDLKKVCTWSSDDDLFHLKSSILRATKKMSVFHSAIKTTSSVFIDEFNAHLQDDLKDYRFVDDLQTMRDYLENDLDVIFQYL